MRDYQKVIQEVVEAGRSKKAQEARVLDLRGIATFTDLFFIFSGASERQVKAIADAVVKRSKDELHLKPSHVEGYEGGDWVLIDYIDFVVHVFGTASRQRYGLERLWHGAEEAALPD